MNRLCSTLLPALAILVAATAVTASTETALAPDTAAAVKSFVSRYEQAINNRDADAVNSCVDLDALLKRATSGLDIPAEFRAGFEAGVRDSFDWGEAMADGLGETGHLRLLKLRQVDGQVRALFRLVTGDGGLNYHDMYMTTTDTGEYRFVDAYVFLSAEDISRTFRRSLEQGLAADGQIDQGMQAVFKGLQQMGECVRSGRYEQALKVYETLPTEARKDKTVQVLRVTCAAHVGAEASDKACNEFRRLFPDDPCVDLVTFDQLFLNKQWDAALLALKRVGAIVGGDAYLDDLAANVQIEAGRTDDAKRLAERAIKSEPTLEDPYWTMLSIALQEKSFDTVASYLSVLERRFDYAFPNLGEVEAYGEFVESDAYRKWRASKVATGGESGVED